MNRSITFPIFLLCGISIFVIPVFIMEPFKYLYMISISLLFLLAYVWAQRKEELQEYRQILLVFLIASIVFFLQIFWISGATVEEIVFNKIISTLVVVIPIILIVKAASGDLSELYLKMGNIRLGAIIGVVTVLLFVLTAIPASIFLFGGQEVTIDRLIVLIPWMTMFVLFNGLKEELLFRGLFMKKYADFMSQDKSNFLQAVIFSLAHLQPTITPFDLIYLILTFFLGLGFGEVMQRTDSIFASVLFHAAADIPVILAIFSVL